MIGIRTANGTIRTQVENHTYFNAGSDERVPSCFDVRNDQIRSLRGTGRGGGEVLAELNRASGTMRSELEYARPRRSNVLPPSKLAVEMFRALNISDGYDNDLE